MDTLIALGSGVAYSYSTNLLLKQTSTNLHFEAAAAITTLVLLGRYLESKARLKANDSIQGKTIIFFYLNFI